MTVQLGERYRDSFTDFEGVAVSRTEYLYGCVRVGLEGTDKDGSPAEYWFDEQRLVHVDTREPVTTNARTGGRRSAPPRSGLRP